MPRIENKMTDIAEGAHTLRIIKTEIVESTVYQTDIPEDKLEVTFVVTTPGEKQDSFTQRLTMNLGDKATLGNIYRACMRTKTVPREGIDSDDLLGKEFECTIGTTESGYPKVVNQSAYPLKRTRISNQEVEEVPWDDTDEPPF